MILFDPKQNMTNNKKNAKQLRRVPTVKWLN
jgi:hypothetical protein